MNKLTKKSTSDLSIYTTTVFFKKMRKNWTKRCQYSPRNQSDRKIRWKTKKKSTVEIERVNVKRKTIRYAFEIERVDVEN
jgi:hypothetical protein